MSLASALRARHRRLLQVVCARRWAATAWSLRRRRWPATARSLELENSLGPAWPPGHLGQGQRCARRGDVRGRMLPSRGGPRRRSSRRIPPAPSTSSERRRTSGPRRAARGVLRLCRDCTEPCTECLWRCQGAAIAECVGTDVRAACVCCLLVRGRTGKWPRVLAACRARSGSGEQHWPVQHLAVPLSRAALRGEQSAAAALGRAGQEPWLSGSWPWPCRAAGIPFKGSGNRDAAQRVSERRPLCSLRSFGSPRFSNVVARADSVPGGSFR